MEIKVTVENVDLNSVVGEHYVPDYDGEPHREQQTLGQAVAAKLAEDLRRDESYPGLKKQFLSIRDEEIRAQVRPIVEAAIAEPVQKTNIYGEPTGEVTTMRELIVAEAQKLLVKPADQYNHRGGTVLQKLVQDEIGRAFQAELLAAVADEKAKVVAAVRAKAAELIATAVKEGVGR